VLRAGVALGSYPERNDPPTGRLDRVALGLVHASGWDAPRLRGVARVAATVEERSRALRDESDAALAAHRVALRRRLRGEGVDGDAALDAFALVCEAARRTLGMTPYPVQVMGGYVMLRGMLAEMETGEGKTLTATLPACTAALAGLPVHVITVNDYLVERDAALMRPLYEFLDLSVGSVLDADPDPQARRAAYACDITYVTNKQIAFDYLRDRLERVDRDAQLRDQVHMLFGSRSGRGSLLLRGLCFAVVDEADSVLVDEARTPLILSRSSEDSELEPLCRQALALAGSLREGTDFTLVQRERRVQLADAGRERIAVASRSLGGLWAGRRRREELVVQALSAQHLYRRDDQYLVRDGKVQIIDPSTGRVMSDRSWEAGLHQMIEVKEGCPVTSPKETLARISYQQFFRRYLRLGGMTGTAREVARELRSVYGLLTFRVPTHRPTRRHALPDRVFARSDQKWEAIVARTEELHRRGCPVLIGTRSVAVSEQLSERLHVRGLPHRVLNARQDRDEAEIIAQAGERGRITIATSMAGRGSDIKLGAEVDALGGLHVIAAERAEARRIDRQLFGRSGRQGDPGSYQRMTSLEDALVTSELPEALVQWARRPGRLRARLATWLDILAQNAAERRHARSRRELAQLEEYYDRALSFAGPRE
jgi:preprotein translocase subunit SecA